MELANFERQVQDEQQGNLEEKHWHGEFRKDEPVSYHQLKAVHDSHKKTVRACAHDAMSPISAISGYLELMQMSLMRDGDAKRIERYRSKIEEGIGDLSKIITELNKACHEEDSENKMNEGRRAS